MCQSLEGFGWKKNLAGNSSDTEYIWSGTEQVSRFPGCPSLLQRTQRGGKLQQEQYPFRQTSSHDISAILIRKYFGPGPSCSSSRHFSSLSSVSSSPCRLSARLTLAGCSLPHLCHTAYPSICRSPPCLCQDDLHDPNKREKWPRRNGERGDELGTPPSKQPFRWSETALPRKSRTTPRQPRDRGACACDKQISGGGGTAQLTRWTEYVHSVSPPYLLSTGNHPQLSGTR